MPPRYPYRIKIVSLYSSSGETRWKEVMTTEVSETRAEVIAIAGRFRQVYPRPRNRVLVFLLDGAREPLPVDWEALEDADGAPQR